MYRWPQIDEVALHSGRMSRTAALMDRLGVDHLLLTGFDSIRFVTDVRTLIIAEAFDWFAAIVDRDGVCDVFVPWVDEVAKDPDPERPWIASLRPLPSWAPALAHPRFWVGSLVDVMEARGARQVGFEFVVADLLDGLRQELPHVRFRPVANDLYELREVKEPVEIELLGAASAVNSRAAEAAMASAVPGVTDHDILAVAMRSLQADGVEYVSHSVCNVRRGSGAWFAVGNELRDGDAFFFDIGCYGRGGYASDMARVAFVGEPPPAVRDAYRRLLDAHAVAEATARPGVRASEVHEATNRELRRSGLPITPYSVGHGVGLRACELPTIHRADRMDQDRVLTEGMVIALEPETGVEVDGRFVLLKIEDDYVVERDGLRRLTPAGYGPEER